MVKICQLIEQKTGVSYHRLEVPGAALINSYPDDFKIVNANGFTLEHRPDYDVIILNRVSRYAETYNYLLEAKEKGAKIILDLDDWIELPEWHGHNHGMITPILAQQINKTIAIADVIWCVSKTLQKAIEERYPDKCTEYIPNAIDFEQPQFKPAKQKQGRYTIGWIGGSSHQHDLEKLIKPLAKLLKRKDYNILLGGYSKTSPDYWNYLERIMTTDRRIKPAQFLRLEALDCYNYAYMYNLMDLALAPLCDDLYSRCKSNIKVLEAGAFSLPIICSNVDPYKEFIEQGLAMVGGGDWKWIQEFIKNPTKGQMLGRRLHDYVREYYDIKTINQLRYDSIKSLMG